MPECLAVGYLGVHVAAGLTPLPFIVPLWSVVAALCMALLAGVLFGVLPAVRAADMDPVEAIRS